MSELLQLLTGAKPYPIPACAIRPMPLLEAVTQPPAIDRDAVLALLSDDALATSFQTLGQYRAHLIGVLKSRAPDEFFNNKDQSNASNP